jgi:signal transduction histidine kinase/ActR/RegA family two-component response regulator
MLQYIRRLLDTRMLSPHGICLLWRPELLWTHVVSDALIFAAYMTIPVALAVILRRRRDIPYGWMLWSFALFITACGFTHLMSIWTLWRPDYGAEALVKAVTAIASITTAVALWLLIPVAVRVPSLAQLQQLNADLQARVRERDAAIADLMREREGRQKAEEALLQSRKLDALGQLTGGIAHDFNNVLHAIQGSLELIRKRAGDSRRVDLLAERALAATERGAALSGQLLAFARRRQLDIRAFFVADLVAALREMLSHTLGPTIDLRFELHAENVPVLVDRTQLELAVMNLALNARDAAGPEGRIVIETRRYVALAREEDLAPGVYVELTVRDNGPGMAPDVHDRAFEPFFTTKPHGKGTGLGLAQVYGFARQVGGTARIDSALGKGTAASLFIPVAEAAPAVQEPQAVIDAGPAAPLNILVVDDDLDVRQTTIDQLEAMGHRAEGLSSAKEALDELPLRRPDALVIDYAMPGMNGAELARAVRQRYGPVAIIIATGYADARPPEAETGREEIMLRKPYSSEGLAAAIERARSGCEGAQV